MAFNFPDVFPGINGALNIRRLETPEFGLLKRLYDQAQSYGKDNSLTQHQLTTLQIPALPTGGQTGHINKFLSTIRSDSVARPSYYAVEVRKFGLDSDDKLRKLGLMCEVAEFPEQVILTATTRTYGPPIEMPYMRVNGRLQLGFIVDKSMNVKLMMDTWMNSIVSGGVGRTLGNNNVGFFNDYVGEIEIFSLSKSTEMPTYSVKLIGAYPKAIESIPLGYQMGGEYMKLNVQFVYQRMELSIVVEDISAIPSPLDEMRLVAGFDKASNTNKTIGGGSNTIIDRFKREQSNVVRRGAEAVGNVTNVFSEIGLGLNNAFTDTTGTPDP